MPPSIIAPPPAAGGGPGLARLVKPMIALHAFGRMQAARPLQPVFAAFQRLPSGLPVTKWRQLYLFRKIIGSRQVAVVFHEHASEHEHRVVRRGYLRDAARHLSSPAGAAHDVVASLRARGAFANVGKIGVVRRISELHAVVAAVHVWNVQDLRPFGEIEPADRNERVVVHASRHQF
jgi:hypothetical protein